MKGSGLIDFAKKIIGSTDNSSDNTNPVTRYDTISDMNTTNDMTATASLKPSEPRDMSVDENNVDDSLLHSNPDLLNDIQDEEEKRQ